MTRERLDDTEHLGKVRTKIRHKIVKFPEIMEGNPDNWWRSTARMLLGFRNRLERCPDPEVVEYFEGYVGAALETLRSSSKLPIVTGETDAIVDQAEHMIMGTSMEMAKKFEPENLDIETFFIPLSEIVSSHPDRLKTEEREVGGVRCTVLQVKHPVKEDWQEVPLPIGKEIWQKGGPSRTVLGIMAGAPLSMQESEHPWNDFDALVAGERGNAALAKAIGADADGIEQMGEDKLNFIKFCLGRDTQQNQVCLGAEGIYFSKGAWQSAMTGHVNIVGEYVANKAIYGIDRMSIQGVDMAKQRGLMRLVKAVAEGKALSFDHVPLNANFDMGVHILFLSKRWAKKGKLPDFSQKMYYLLKQMGQVREGENDIFDVLERAHQESPFFDFDSEVHTQLQVVRWKAKKIVKQIDREAAWQLGLPSSMVIKRSPGDSIPYKVSLEGFVQDQTRTDDQKRWEVFLERSKHRTAEEKDTEKTMFERVFGASYENTDDLLSSSEMTLT